MNTEELSTRYKINSKEVEDFIQKHFVELKNYVHYENEMWAIEDDSLYMLDKLIGHPVDENDRKKINQKKGKKKLNEKKIEKPQKQIQEVEVELEEKEEKKEQEQKPFEINNEIFLQENDNTLERKLQEAEERANNLATELSNLQDKFIKFQNGQNAMNSSFIKKQQVRAETAEHELKKFKQKAKEDAQYKDGQIKGFQERINEMQEKLIENHNQINEKQEEINKLSRQIEEIKEEAAQRCSKAELKVLESKRNEEKLYAELHETETKLQDMSYKVNIANDERSEAICNATIMKSEIIDIKAKLIEITAELSNYLTDIETDSVSNVLKNEKKIEIGKAENTEEEIKSTPENPIENEKNTDFSTSNNNTPLLSHSIKLKEHQSFWQKVASFF